MRLILLCILLTSYFLSNSWGFQSHKTINFQAVFLLPEPLYGFYRQHINIIQEWAIKADQRRYIVQNEGSKHFLDIDHYESALPLDTIGLPYDSACQRYTEDSLMEHGILPWNLNKVYWRLVYAMKKGESIAILKLSADLGHYTADAHVPLHTTSNYNGQLSGQYGIHALWESRLPELYSSDYQFFADKACYYYNVDSLIWAIIETSHSLLPEVFDNEKLLTEEFGVQKYAFETKYNRLQKVYSAEFCEAYHLSLNNMVEKRLLEAMHVVSSLWYSAWVNAGRPLLSADSSSVVRDLADSSEILPKSNHRTLLH